MTRTTRQPVLSKTGCREFGRDSSMTAAEINASALDRNRFGVSLPLILGSLVYLKVILSGGAVVHDADPYWHNSHRALDPRPCGDPEARRVFLHDGGRALDFAGMARRNHNGSG